MVSTKFIFALCCSVGVALPFAVSAQLSQPQMPGSGAPSIPGGLPSTSGEMTPSTPSGVPTPKATDLTTPGTGGGTTPSTDVPTPIMTPSPSPSPGVTPSLSPTVTPSPSPSVTPSPSPTVTPSPSSTAPKKSGKSTTVKVNVNSSTLQELTKVKGIGAPTAKKIIMYRPYVSMEELVTKKALTQKQLTELKPQLGL